MSFLSIATVANGGDCAYNNVSNNNDGDDDASSDEVRIMTICNVNVRYALAHAYQAS